MTLLDAVLACAARGWTRPPNNLSLIPGIFLCMSISAAFWERIYVYTHTYERDLEDTVNVVGFALYILYLIWVKWVEEEEREIGRVRGPGREVDNVKCMVA